MDKQELIKKSIEMRNEGKTYKEIADNFGFTKQYIYQIIGRKRKCSNLLNNLKYKGLKKYFTDNDLSFSNFERICNIGKGKIFNLCKCEKSKFNIEQIKNMEKITGMTFDELFEEK